jgi:hypothetical protein
MPLLVSVGMSCTAVRTAYGPIARVELPYDILLTPVAPAGTIDMMYDQGLLKIHVHPGGGATYYYYRGSVLVVRTAGGPGTAVHVRLECTTLGRAADDSCGRPAVLARVPPRWMRCPSSNSVGDKLPSTVV